MSPTIHRERGFAFVLNTDDHEPPHLHLFKSEWEAKIALGDLKTRPWVIDPGRMPGHEVREAIRLVMRNQGRFLAEWRKYHG